MSRADRSRVLTVLTQLRLLTRRLGQVKRSSRFSYGRMCMRNALHVTHVNSQTSRHALVYQCTPGMERLDNGYISSSGRCRATGVVRP